ncbi:nitroreductase family protein [Porphyromonadaceae bacterium W3.11]|nr:nitroreductase family protein [Porphyromonadaceae bacterium W3.11]
MNFYELINHRQSDRKYDSSRPIPRDVIDRIINAARLAPSATNSQPWHFIVVDEPELKSKVASALTSTLTGNMNKFATEASALIVILEEPANAMGKMGNLILKKHFPHIDLGIAASHIVLAAAEEGIGSCIIGWVNEKKVRELLDIPNKKAVPLVISLGYSLEEPKQKKRKALGEISSYNGYQKSKLPNSDL